MPGGKHEKVVVTFVGGKPQCDKEWVHLFWDTGPDSIRWVFKHVPKQVVKIDVEFLDKVPKKYKVIPGFLHRPPFRGMGFEPPTGGSKIDDVVTIGIVKEKGYFCYEIYFKDADGAIVAQLDPGGTIDPSDPPSPIPPTGP